MKGRRPWGGGERCRGAEDRRTGRWLCRRQERVAGGTEDSREDREPQRGQRALEGTEGLRGA